MATTGAPSAAERLELAQQPADRDVHGPDLAVVVGVGRIALQLGSRVMRLVRVEEVRPHEPALGRRQSAHPPERRVDDGLRGSLRHEEHVADPQVVVERLEPVGEAELGRQRHRGDERAGPPARRAQMAGQIRSFGREGGRAVVADGMEGGSMPVRIVACDGAVSGVGAKASRARTPPRSARSIAGVSPPGCPRHPARSARNVSTVTRRRSGGPEGSGQGARSPGPGSRGAQAATERIAASRAGSRAGPRAARALAGRGGGAAGTQSLRRERRGER